MKMLMIVDHNLYKMIIHYGKVKIQYNYLINIKINGLLHLMVDLVGKLLKIMVKKLQLHHLIGVLEHIQFN